MNKILKILVALATVLIVTTALIVPALSDGRGPPIGGNSVSFSKNPASPGELVTVTINWWLNDPYTNDPSDPNYAGPFYLKLDLNKGGTEYWHYEGTVTGLSYETTFPAPEEVGIYNFDVQILALGVEEESGSSGIYHFRLVASEGGEFTTVPEFTTIAVPVAAILGLFLFFNYRKRR
jgi:hypothetical protein